MRSGFSSLELIMAMTVSAIIMTTLLEIYYQVSRNMIRVERFVFEDTQILTLKNRFGKDLSGLSAIWFTQADIDTKKSAVDGQKTSAVAQDTKKTSKYFYSVNKSGNLELLTFITTNALQSYGDVQDRFIRVLYKVEADPKHEGLFRLMRKEISIPTENVDEEALKLGRFYELVSGIKSIDMTYQLIDMTELQKQEKAKKNPQDQAGSQEKQEIKPVIRPVKQWGTDTKKNPSPSDKTSSEKTTDDQTEEKQEDLGGAAVPKFVEMKIVFGVTDKQLEKEYKLEFCIPSTVDNVPKDVAKIVAVVPASPGA